MGGFRLLGTPAYHFIARLSKRKFNKIIEEYTILTSFYTCKHLNNMYANAFLSYFYATTYKGENFVISSELYEFSLSVYKRHVTD